MRKRFVSFRASVVTATLVFSPLVLAHNPPNPIPGATASGSSYGGYGYLGRAEAEASEIVRFGCDSVDIAAYAAQGGAPCQSQDVSIMRSCISSSLRPLVLQRLREQLYEYLQVLNAAGQTWDTPRHYGALSRPSPDCLGPRELKGDHVGAIIGPHLSVSGTPADVYASTLTAAPRNQEERETLDRFRSVSTQTMDQNMAKALALNDQMDWAWRQLHCSCTSTRCTGASVEQCIGLAGQLARLHQSYSVLFTAPEADREAMRQALYTYLASPGEAGEDPGVRRARGEALYQGYTRTYSANTRAGFDRRLDSRYGFAAAVAPSVAASAPVVQARDAFAATARRIRGYRSGQVAGMLRSLCNYDLAQLTSMFPNVTRQALLDMPENLRAATKAVLCSENLPGLQYLRQPDSCIGVAGGPLPSPINVRTSNYSEWPYNGFAGYTLSGPDPAGVRTVESTVYFRPDPGLDAAQVTAQLGAWENDTRKWFNCQAGEPVAGRTCPPPGQPAADPRMRFNVHMAIAPTGTNPQPLVQLHSCYRNETQSHDCADIAAHWGGANREDSGNYTLSTNPMTVVHEVAHTMGLDDEYTDDAVFDRLGEHDSIMNNSSYAGARFYPRHFRRINDRAEACRRP